MKYKTSLRRSAIIIAILVLSIVFGFVFSAIGSLLDKKVYPREYSEYVTKYAEEYAVPEYLVYAVIKTESDFNSGSKGEDGGIGLMGVSPEDFDVMLKATKENLTYDALYGPETNIKYGTYQLSRLYNMFEKWSIACAAKYVGEEEAALWLASSANFNEDGVFERVPDEDAVKNGEALYECADKYRRMYYGD